MSPAVVLLACLLVLLANLAVLGMTVKLYTELFKDKQFDRRARETGHDGGRPLSTSRNRPAGVKP